MGLQEEKVMTPDLIIFRLPSFPVWGMATGKQLNTATSSATDAFMICKSLSGVLNLGL